MPIVSALMQLAVNNARNTDDEQIKPPEYKALLIMPYFVPFRACRSGIILIHIDNYILAQSYRPFHLLGVPYPLAVYPLDSVGSDYHNKQYAY